MKFLNVLTGNKKEFDIALSLLMEFGKDRKPLSWKEDDDNSFVFVMKGIDEKEVASEKMTTKKSSL